MNTLIKIFDTPDYGLFQFRACIDWIEVEVNTLRATHGHHIWEKLKTASYVNPLNPGSANEATKFSVRYQDIESWSCLADRLRKLEEQFPLASPPTITGVEIAFDAYSKGANKSQMQEMTARLFKCASTITSENYRFSGKTKGGATGIFNTNQILRMIQDGRIINVGNADDDISQRIYLKMTDGNLDLPPELWRARFECTFRGNALPFKSLEEARKFDFAELSKYFKFRRVEESDSPVINLLNNYTAIIGTRAKRRTADHSFRLYARNTKADTKLNRTAYDALRGLTKSLNKSSSRGRRPLHKSAVKVDFAG